MSLLEPINAYCERLGPEYWAEPVNAATNAAFLIAAVIMATRLRGSGLVMGWAMVGVLATIGIGSFLFHTHANRLSAILDVVPILCFILLYIFAATRDILGLSQRSALMAVVGFIPYSAALVPIFSLVPGLGSSAGYAPVPLLILIYAGLSPDRQTARGLALGAGILLVSLTFRTLDMPLCVQIPVGTHFLWHILNGIMLGWMIEVYRRHMVRAARAPERSG